MEEGASTIIDGLKSVDLKEDPEFFYEELQHYKNYCLNEICNIEEVNYESTLNGVSESQTIEEAKTYWVTDNPEAFLTEEYYKKYAPEISLTDWKHAPEKSLTDWKQPTPSSFCCCYYCRMNTIVEKFKKLSNMEGTENRGRIQTRKTANERRQTPITEEREESRKVEDADGKDDADGGWDSDELEEVF